MPKRVLEGAAQEQRVKQRKELGSLRELTVQPVTRARYSHALDDFYAYLKQENLVLPPKAHQMDKVVADYLEFLWAQGSGRSSGSNVLAALQDKQPQLKGKLQESWRLMKAWVTHEMPNRAPRLPLELLECMIGYALFKQLPLFALSLVLGFHGLLRTGEIFQICARHVTVTRPKGPAVISLGWTKAGKRHGAAESVTIHVEDVRRRLFQWCSQVRPSTLLVPSGPQWRQQFSATVEAVGFSGFDFRPYSLRRGGATYMFQQHGNLDKLLIFGRWQTAKTAGIYLNDGLAVLAELRFQWSGFAKNMRKQYLTSLTVPLPSLEPQARQRAEGRGRWKNKRQAPKKSKKQVVLLPRAAFPVCLGHNWKGSSLLWPGFFSGLG